MKQLLRSITWGDQKEKDEATASIRDLRMDRLVNLNKVEQEVLQAVQEFMVQFGEAPSIQVISRQFEVANNGPAMDLLEQAVGVTNPLISASLRQHFEQLVEERAADRLVEVLKETAKIAKLGVTKQGQLIKGTDAAIAHFFASAEEKPKVAEGRVPASISQAATYLKTLYQKRKSNPHHTYGVMTGYGLIDSSTGGIRKKQLYLHAGFGGHLKSTMMFNMIVNAAVDGGWNPLLFTSEMPAEDVMYILASIHSGNPKFNTIHPPLNSQRLILGNLSAAEEAFYEQVFSDLTTNTSHGSIRVIDSSDFTSFGSVMQRTMKEHAMQEVDLLWVDYVTRLPVDAKYIKLSQTEARNETVADAKRFAMSFDGGVGLAVCSPFQVNREGYKRAKDNAGRLDKTSLAQYNAAEREADIITGIFYGEDEQATSEPKLCMIKSRWGKMIYQPMSLFLEPDSRRIFDLSAGMSVGPATQAQNVDDTVTL